MKKVMKLAPWVLHMLCPSPVVSGKGLQGRLKDLGWFPLTETSVKVSKMGMLMLHLAAKKTY